MYVCMYVCTHNIMYVRIYYKHTYASIYYTNIMVYTFQNVDVIHPSPVTIKKRNISLFATGSRSTFRRDPKTNQDVINMNRARMQVNASSKTMTVQNSRKTTPDIITTHNERLELETESTAKLASTTNVCTTTNRMKMKRERELRWMSRQASNSASDTMVIGEDRMTLETETRAADYSVACENGDPNYLITSNQKMQIENKLVLIIPKDSNKLEGIKTLNTGRLRLETDTRTIQAESTTTMCDGYIEETGITVYCRPHTVNGNSSLGRLIDSQYTNPKNSAGNNDLPASNLVKSQLDPTSTGLQNSNKTSNMILDYKRKARKRRLSESDFSSGGCDDSDLDPDYDPPVSKKHSKYSFSTSHIDKERNSRNFISNRDVTVENQNSSASLEDKLVCSGALIPITQEATRYYLSFPDINYLFS